MQFPSKGSSAYFAFSQRQPLFLFLMHVRNETFTQKTDVLLMKFMKIVISLFYPIKNNNRKITVADLWIIQWRLTRNGHFHLSL